MNELIDRLFDLPARQRYLLLGSIVLGMLFSYMTYFYWPLSGEIAVRQEEVIGLRHDRDRKLKMVADLGAMLGSWGHCGACSADLTGDGAVNAQDLAILLGAWGATNR